MHKIAQNQEADDTGRYNFGQKCVFWVATSTLLLRLASGSVLWRPYFANAFCRPGYLRWAGGAFCCCGDVYHRDRGADRYRLVGERNHERHDRRLSHHHLGEKGHPRCYRALREQQKRLN